MRDSEFCYLTRNISKDVTRGKECYKTGLFLPISKNGHLSGISTIILFCASFSRILYEKCHKMNAYKHKFKLVDFYQLYFSFTYNHVIDTYLNLRTFTLLVFLFRLWHPTYIFTHVRFLHDNKNCLSSLIFVTKNIFYWF